MARPVERRVRQIEDQDVNLGSSAIQGAAQTTRALGSTRVGGWVANNRHSLMGLSALSRGLGDALKTVGMFAAEEKQEDIKKGRDAFQAGETFEDQASRGLQEGYLASSGKAKGVEVSNELQEFYNVGAWREEGKTWEAAKAEFMKDKLQGLERDRDSEYFLNGFLPVVESTSMEMDSKEVEKRTNDAIFDRTEKMKATIRADFQAVMTPEHKLNVATKDPEERAIALAELRSKDFIRKFNEGKKHAMAMGVKPRQYVEEAYNQAEAAAMAYVGDGDLESALTMVHLISSKYEVGKDKEGNPVMGSLATSNSKAFQNLERRVTNTFNAAEDEADRDARKNYEESNQEEHMGWYSKLAEAKTTDERNGILREIDAELVKQGLRLSDADPIMAKFDAYARRLESRTSTASTKLKTRSDIYKYLKENPDQANRPALELIETVFRGRENQAEILRTIEDFQDKNMKEGIAAFEKDLSDVVDANNLDETDRGKALVKKARASIQRYLSLEKAKADLEGRGFDPDSKEIKDGVEDILLGYGEKFSLKQDVDEINTKKLTVDPKEIDAHVIKKIGNQLGTSIANKLGGETYEEIKNYVGKIPKEINTDDPMLAARLLTQMKRNDPQKAQRIFDKMLDKWVNTMDTYLDDSGEVSSYDEAVMSLGIQSAHSVDNSLIREFGLFGNLVDDPELQMRRRVLSLQKDAKEQLEDQWKRRLSPSTLSLLSGGIGIRQDDAQYETLEAADRVIQNNITTIKALEERAIRNKEK